MLYLACAVCGQPRPIATLHAWAHDAPLCSAACANAWPARPAPDRAAAIARSIESIDASIELARRAIDGIADVAGAREAAMRIPDGAFFELHGLGGPLAQAEAQDAAERALGRQQDLVWSLEQRLALLTRQLMALHGLGLPIAARMAPLVSEHASPDAGGAEQLARLRDYLGELRATISGWA